MRTHLLCAVALGLAGTASAAAAQTGPTTSDFHVNSNVARYCTPMTTPPVPLDLGAIALDDGRVGDTFANSPTYAIAGYYCNAPATITIEAAPLVNADPGPFDQAVFTDTIDYSATLNWGSLSEVAVSSDAQASTLNPALAHTGNLALSFSAPNTNGDLRPVGGNYAGSITLTVTFNP